MYECDRCGKQVKSESGLKRHQNTCEVVEDEIVEEEQIVDIDLSYNVARKISKLRDAWKSTPDAEARHNIEMQIKELKNGRTT